MTFAGFDRVSAALLSDLPGFDASTFAEHRAVLTTGLVKPRTSLIHEVAEQLDAGLTVVPRSSVSPLHTDLRFAAPGARRRATSSPRPHRKVSNLPRRAPRVSRAPPGQSSSLSAGGTGRVVARRTVGPSFAACR